jgi:DNA-binding IclR family transcriptional regulator
MTRQIHTGAQISQLQHCHQAEEHNQDITQPHLIRLSKQIKETVSLFCFEGEKIIFVDEIYSKYPSKIAQDAAAFTPLHSSAVGKIALANRTTLELENYFGSKYVQSITANTITDPDQLREHLKQVARDGVAYDDEERYPGIRAVAVSIRDNTDKLAACICILGPATRLTIEKMQRLMPDIKNCAMQISIELGYLNNQSPRQPG